jgi:hypothetical protein
MASFRSVRNRRCRRRGEIVAALADRGRPRWCGGSLGGCGRRWPDAQGDVPVRETRWGTSLRTKADQMTALHLLQTRPGQRDHEITNGGTRALLQASWINSSPWRLILRAVRGANARSYRPPAEPAIKIATWIDKSEISMDRAILHGRQNVFQLVRSRSLLP